MVETFADVVEPFPILTLLLVLKLLAKVNEDIAKLSFEIDNTPWTAVAGDVRLFVLIIARSVDVGLRLPTQLFAVERDEPVPLDPPSQKISAACAHLVVVIKNKVVVTKATRWAKQDFPEEIILFLFIFFPYGL